MCNNYNWINKEERAKQAVEHTKLMEEQYQLLINECIKRTKTYSH